MTIQILIENIGLYNPMDEPKQHFGVMKFKFKVSKSKNTIFPYFLNKLLLSPNK